MTAEELASKIHIEEPEFTSIPTTSRDKYLIYNKMRYYYWKTDMLEQLVARADLDDDCNIEAAILKHISSLNESEQTKAFNELAERLNDELYDLEYKHTPMLLTFEEYERRHKLMWED